MSVVVGFLYMPKDRLLGFFVMVISRKWMWLSCSSSIVNFNLGDSLLNSFSRFCIILILCFF